MVVKGPSFDIVVCGVGGQGVVTASDALAQAALNASYDVKKSEVHGMAQRGGSVVSHVRFGASVCSPVIPSGAAGFMLAMERLEALRYAHLLAPGALVVLNRVELHTLSEYGGAGYPGDVEGALSGLDARVVGVPGRQIAEDAGDARAMGTVLLGALSEFLPVPARAWNAALRDVMGARRLAVNMEAFRLGRSWVSTEGR